MLKLVILDAYGTLLYTGTSSVDAAGRVLCRAGRADIPAGPFYARWKEYHRMHLDAADPFVDERTVFLRDLMALYREYGIDRDAREDIGTMLAIQGTREAYPESREVLDALRGAVRTCVGSTTDTAPLLADMARGGLVTDRVFTSEDMRVYKPRPRFYATILDAMGVDASEALFVGDSPIDDVAGPGRMGIRTCWVNRKGGVCTPAPDFEIADLRGLPAVVEGLLQEK